MTTANNTAMIVRDTGEIVPANASFDMASFVAELKNPAHAAQQTALMGLYDQLCQSIIGPNDVQVEGARSFKKKSAWRKLARAFRISVACDLNDVRVDRSESGEFTAIASSTATAPWGQSWTDVGACSSDEAVGRRVITQADAIATAMTRASNRAVSNLIAMGEVSAEEIGQRKPYGNESRSNTTASANGNGFVMPFGKSKGKKLTEMTVDDLSGALQWAKEKNKFDEFQAAATKELQRRSVALVGSADEDPRDLPSALEDVDDDLPF